MTRTHSPSYGLFRAFADSLRRHHLAGSTAQITDRDLDRVALDLISIPQADERGEAEPKTGALARPIDLHLRRARSAQPTRPTPDATPPHAEAC
jgi:hypothetical protein